MAVILESDAAVAARLALQPGDTLQLSSGTYQIRRCLGEGGFGIVYEVQGTGPPHAFKVLKLWEIMPKDQRELADRFTREFHAGQIESPHIVRSIQYGQVQGNPYILMAFCEGGSLHDHRARYQEAPRLTPVARAILQGLHDLHRHGVIHRDLKPENVLFNSENRPLLTDFGIAGHVNKRTTQPNWRGHVRQVWGTAVYLPPEQHDVRTAFRTLGPTTDLFAFGVMMYELLTGGHFPFGSFDDFLEDQVGFYQRVQSGTYTPVVSYCPTLTDLWVVAIERCLQPDPAERFQTAQSLLEHLADAESLPLRRRSQTPIPTDAAWYLRVMHGDAVGMRYNLTRLLAYRGRRLLTLGWLDEAAPHLNDIGLLDRYTNYLSGRHATLEHSEGLWYLRDGQWYDKHGTDTPRWHPSTNGTYVNYQRIDAEQGCLLQPDDIIRMGDTTLRVEVEAPPA